MKILCFDIKFIGFGNNPFRLVNKKIVKKLIKKEEHIKAIKYIRETTRITNFYNKNKNNYNPVGLRECKIYFDAFLISTIK